MVEIEISRVWMTNNNLVVPRIGPVEFLAQIGLSKTIL